MMTEYPTTDRFPALVAGFARAAWRPPGGPARIVTVAEIPALIRRATPLVCHAPTNRKRLGRIPLPALDLLELFAFVRPANRCAPTPSGLARSLNLPVPEGPESGTDTLALAAQLLLAELTETTGSKRDRLTDMALHMRRGSWRWTEAVLEALDADPGKPLDPAVWYVWNRLPEWKEEPPPSQPGHAEIGESETRKRLGRLLARDPHGRPEIRPAQGDYAAAAARAFAPTEQKDVPHLVLAEAGTGTGKTLGYLAPASLWSEKNGGTVWISTYTRNLQCQVDTELDRLYAKPKRKAERTVIRKGRENYVCLLNVEEAVGSMTSYPNRAVALGLMMRWIESSRDGDFTGADFPGWLPELIGTGMTLGLSDRRGECIHSACPHYRRCLIERGIRKSRRADFVIANHALVMIQAAMGAGDEGAKLPTRLVFDEGHHLFNAADSVFSGHLTGLETAELRRWLIGAPAGGRRRAKGLRRRLEGLIETDKTAPDALNDLLNAATALPDDGWIKRLAGQTPKGAGEHFLERVREQVLARASDGPYSQETETRPFIPGLTEAANDLDAALAGMHAPLTKLIERLRARLVREVDSLSGDERKRLESACRTLNRRGLMAIAAWRSMLEGMREATPADMVDWFEITRENEREVDIGMHRHHIDPTQPLADSLTASIHGLLITSASLRDSTESDTADWASADRLVGASHIPAQPVRFTAPSPFDFGNRTRVLIVNDIPREDMDQLAAAFRALMVASGGGGLGLFTAIRRLRAVHSRI
ncbi:MAG: ATP-dependent DNA helicase, partial [Pseudomonadota bacterium]|nr:ATP-dependent DNA helicase [Pseudomonadota bacterium]